MNALEEQKDLRENPLPIAIPSHIEPTRLPTHIHELDREIDDLLERVGKLREERDTVLKYAIASNTREDIDYRIVDKIKRFRTLDRDILIMNYPKEFALAKEIERAKLEGMIDDVGNHLPLGTIDKVMGKYVDKVIKIEEKIIYVIERVS